MAETTTPKKRGRKAAAAGQPVTQEVVVMVPLAELHPFPDHPFQVRDDESMRETAASVKENGVIIPGLVRPREEGGYEIIAGHRRKHACELAGLTAMPVIVRDMDRDSATVVMVDSNLQRVKMRRGRKERAILSFPPLLAQNDLLSAPLVPLSTTCPNSSLGHGLGQALK